MAAQFPVNLNLAGRRVLVVGAGRIALRKTEQLLVADALVTVVAPDVHAGFADLPVTVLRDVFAPAHLEGQRLVITATGVRDVDQEIFDLCESRGIWVNSADDPDRCTFTLPAVVRRGDLLVAVSTGGSSPALSSYLRRRLETVFGPSFADVVDDLSRERDRFHAEGISTETIDWAPIIDETLARHGVSFVEVVA